MKKKEVTEVLSRSRGKKVLRKRMTETLCVMMTASMVAGQPLTAFASDDIESVQTITESADEPVENISESAEGSIEDSIEDPVEVSADVETYSENTVEIPSAQMPELEAGKKYTVPFRMYKAESVETDEEGNKQGEISMGEFCVQDFNAELEATQEGDVRIKIRLKPEAATVLLNYFESEEDFETYFTSNEQFLPEMQNLKKGGTPSNPKDGVVYETVATDEYYENDKAISTITFTAPSVDSTIFFVVCAAGMNDGHTEQFGAFGFDYTQLKEVEPETPEVQEPSYVTDLKAKTAEAKDLKNDDGRYSAGSFAEVTKAVSDAEALIFAGDVTEEAAAQCVEAIDKAVSKLVDISGLKTAIDTAEEKLKDADKYTGVSVSNLRNALNDARTVYYKEKPSKKEVENSVKSLTSAMDEMKEKVKNNFDINNLADGTYEVDVNLWHESQDKASMGDMALDHTAVLTVKDGKYTLRVMGHETTMMGVTGGLAAMRIIPDGSAPAEDESNYKEIPVIEEGKDYIVDFEIENASEVSEYYYASIKLKAEGAASAMLPKGWMDSRLRISWDTITSDTVVPEKPEKPEKPSVDVSALETALTHAKEITNDDNSYSEGSFGALSSAVSDAEVLLKSADATEEDVVEAVKALKAAENGLVKIGELKDAIDKADAVLAQTKEYSGASLSIYKGVVDSAKTTYGDANATQKKVDNAVKKLSTEAEKLVKTSKENLDINNLEDGTYEVAVNLWHETQDKESMGNMALDHTALLTVRDGVYSIRIIGHETVMMGMKGGLEKLRIIPDGSKPAEDGSNYKEVEVQQDGKDYIVDIVLENCSDVTEYYYSGIVISMAPAKMAEEAEDWMDSRLRISWETLSQKERYVNVDALNDAINSAKEIKNEDSRYSAGSYKKLLKAVKDAEELLASDDKTKESVAEAVKNIETAKNGLVDLRELKTLIDEGDAKLKETDVYTDASLAKLKATLNTAKTYYYQENPAQSDVTAAIEMLKADMAGLVKVSEEDLDKNALQDGVYTVAVNLWHATDNKESMGNDALYHTAVLTVKDGKYSLRISGHQMTMSGQTGELDALRIVPDGTAPKGDGSNYTELAINKDGSDYYIDVELENPEDVTDYYYAGIKVHTIDAKGNVGYPMGTNWINNRLRISWETLAVKESADKYPAFSATDSETGVTVTAPEGALPAGTKLRVTKVTDQDKLDSVNSALTSLAEKNDPYQISLYVEKDGKEETIEPKNGIELTITLPVPEEYNSSKVTCYYVDENNFANPITGTLKDNTYTVSNSKIGIYAIAEKKGRDTTLTVKTGTSSGTKPTVTSSTKPTTSSSSKSVKTGDETTFAATLMGMMAALSAAAGAFVLRRKKDDPENN